MSITVDTVNLRFNVKPDYDQQQLQQMQEDLKQGEKQLKKTRQEIAANTKEHTKLNEKLREAKERRDQLAAQKTRTDKENLELGRLIRTVAEYEVKVKESSDRMTVLSQKFTQQAQAIRQTQVKMDQYVDEMGIASMSIAQLSQRQKDLNAVLRQLNPKSEEFATFSEELREVNARMKELRDSTRETQEALEDGGSGWGAFADNISKGVVALNAVLQIKDRIMAWADEYVSAFASMDEAMTDVMKYTGQTKAEVEQMNETFKRMDTRTSREELNALAGAAGRLGISAEKDIVEFVDAADKINVALGDDLGQGAIDQIGKLTIVFGEDKTKGLNSAMLATGSAINELGASSSAATGFIVDFTSRVAGMAQQAGISQTDIMGYASALSQAGVEGQTASGVFAQLVTKMFTDPAKFARAASIDVKQFTDLLRTDANQAILQFLDAMQRKGGFDQLAPMLKSLQMQGTQAIPVLTAMAGKLDELKEAQDVAANAYNSGTSILNEFTNANSSAQAMLDKQKKAMNDASVELGQKLLPLVEAGIGTATQMARLLSSLVSWFVRYKVSVTATAVAIGLMVAWKQKDIIVTKAMTVVNEKLWTSLSKLGKFLKANWVGATITALTAMAAALWEVKRRSDGLTESERNINKIREQAKRSLVEEEQKIRLLIAAAEDETLSMEDRKTAVDKLNSIIPGYNAQLDETTGKYIASKEALDNYLSSLVRSYEIEGAKERLAELGKELADADAALKKAMKTAGNLRGKGPSTGLQGDVFFWVGQNVGSNMSVSNAQEAKDKVQGQIDDLLDAFGEDLKKEAVKVEVEPEVEVNPQVTDSPTPTSTTTDDTQKKREQARRQAEAQLKADYERELLLLKQARQQEAMTEEQYQQERYLAEEAYLRDLGALRKEAGASQAEQQEVTNRQLDALLAEQQRQRQQREKEMNDALSTAEMSHRTDQIALEQQYWQGDFKTEEEYLKKKQEAELDYLRQRVALIRQYGGDSTQAEEAMWQAQLQQTVTAAERRQRELEQQMKKQPTMNTGQRLQLVDDNAEVLGWKRTQEMKTQILEEEEQKRKEIQQAAYDSVDALMQSTSSLFSALQSREVAQVDAKYKKLIAAAKKQGKDTAALEEQQEAEKMEIQKKYAQKQFRLQVLQIIAATAQAIANVWKQWAANPTVAAALSAVAAAQGAIQLATAKAQADQAAGLYEGGYTEGYTERGNPKEQAGVIPVHKNEFVANHYTVGNSQLRPLLDAIDLHQRRGDVQLLNATRLLQEAYGLGHYAGGFSTMAPADTAAAPFVALPSQASSEEQLSLLRSIERNTAGSLTIRELRDEIAHQERLEQNASR